MDYNLPKKFDDSWTFYNNLPISIYLFHVNNNILSTVKNLPFGTSNKTTVDKIKDDVVNVRKFVKIIKPKDNVIFDKSQFNHGDIVMGYIKYKNRFIQFLKPHYIDHNNKLITIGSSIYKSLGTSLESQTSYADISGVWIFNHLMVPLNIYYKGRLAAQIDGHSKIREYDEKNSKYFGYHFMRNFNVDSYFGGSSSQLYFDNNRNGLNLGDELIFTFSSKFFKDLKLFSIILTDNHNKRIDIGLISAVGDGKYADTFSYGVDDDHKAYNNEDKRWNDNSYNHSQYFKNLGNYTHHVAPYGYSGITYYKPLGNYTSQVTNPNAPM